MQQICAKAYYSTQDSHRPMRTTLLAVVLNFILNLILIWPLGAAGLALATSIASYVQVTILLKGLADKFGRKIFDGVVNELVKTVVITLVMSVVAFFVLKLTGSMPKLIQLSIVVIATVFLYLAGAVILKVEMLSLITGRKLLE
jgi:putative peptidoglycan lipid II flippase